MKQVICPITKEVITTEACLAHAIEARPAPCGYDYVLLKTMFRESERTGIHVTDLLGCLKRTVLTKTNPIQEPVPALLARVLGTLTHAVLESNGSEEALSEIPVTRDGLVGTVDLFYPKQKTLVDYKTTRWLKPANLPYGEHEMQVNIYAWMLEGMGYEVEKLFIQYIDLSGPSKCRSCKIYYEWDGEQLVCPRCGRTASDAHMGTAMIEVEKMDSDSVGRFVAKRKADVEAGIETGYVRAEPSWLCNYCAHLSVCRDGQDFTNR